jgi:hypothetical protein
VKNLVNSIPSPDPSGNCAKGYYCPTPTTSYGSATPYLIMTDPGYFSFEKSTKQYPCLISIAPSAKTVVATQNPLYL